MLSLLQSYCTAYNKENTTSVGLSLILSGVIDKIHCDIDWEPIIEEYCKQTDANRIQQLPKFERYKLANSAATHFKVESESKPHTLHFYSEDDITAHFEMLSFILGLNGNTEVIRLLLLYAFRETPYIWPYEFENEFYWQERFQLIERYVPKPDETLETSGADDEEVAQT